MQGIIARLAAALLLVLPAVAHAQISWQVQNISPVQSNLDGADPNSASGGRVNQLGVNPANTQVALAASEWGGLFRTTDGGRNWAHVQGHSPQATWDVEFNPGNTNSVFATSGFDGRATGSQSGINVSRDGGVTWAVPATSRPTTLGCARAGDAAEPAAFGIAIDPSNNNRIYIGTSCGLAISTDNGFTWVVRDPTPASIGARRVVDVFVHANGTVDICGDDGHQRSTDNGATFVEGATTEARGTCSIVGSPDETNTIFMVVGSDLVESRDGGATWPTTFTEPGRQGRIPFLQVNNRAGADFDLWFGDTQLFRIPCRTPAAGTARRCPDAASWVNAQAGAHWDVGDIAFGGGAVRCPILYSNDGGVYFNTRTGANCHDPVWEQPTTTVTAMWLWDMAGRIRPADGEEGVYLGQQDTGGFGSRDGPRNPPGWNAPSCCDVFDVEVEAARSVYTVCCFNGGRATRLFRANDTMGGSSEIPTYPAGNLLGFQDAETLTNYAPGSYGVVTSAGIFFTTNIGGGSVTWQALGTNQPANVCGITMGRRPDGGVDFYARAGGNACSIIGGGSGSIWRHDGATTTGDWVRVNRDGNSNFGVFAVNREDPRLMLANDMSGTTPAMVTSRDGGATWATMPALDTLLAGGGAFQARVRFGATGAGYPQASLAAINLLNPEMMVVGGQDSGLFLTANGGRNWSMISDPRTATALRPHVSRPLYAHFEPVGTQRWNVYVGARGRGVWRVAVNVENRWAGAIWQSTGVACTGDACPGWRRLDNNVATTALVAAGGQVYQLHGNGHIWRGTGAACDGDSCPGWVRLDNNPRTIAIAAGGASLYQLHNDGRIWRFTGTACTGDNCPGWTLLDNNARTVAIAAGGSSLYQLHRDGRIWRSTGAACTGSGASLACPGWTLLDNNPRTVAIAAAGSDLYQLHHNGRIWRSTGGACTGRGASLACPGWTMLDNNPATADIAAIGGLVQRHRNGWLWRATGTACSGEACPGWQRIDNNPATVMMPGRDQQLHHDGRIWRFTGTACSGDACPGWAMVDNNAQTLVPVASDGNAAQLFQLHAPALFQRHSDGAIWQSRGGACTGDACPHWQRLDNNAATRAVVAAAGRLYQLHADGRIWQSDGRPCTDDVCPGWRLLDANPATRQIVAGGGQLYQRHADGRIWRATGQACSGSGASLSCPGWVLLDANARTVEILASGGQLFQRHNSGALWRSTGQACSGSGASLSCPGWALIDNNPRTVRITGDNGRLYQQHNNGLIWEFTGQPCASNSACPGWRLIDNNPATAEIVAGGNELYQRHGNGLIWEFTGTACSGSGAQLACPGWRLLDNNPLTRQIAATGGLVYQRHADGAVWRSTGRACTGSGASLSCPGWVRLDNNSRTVEIIANRQ
jgi:hypothetical protein